MQGTLFREIWAVIGAYRRRFLLSLVVVMISNVLLILNPMLFRHAVSEGGSGWMWGGVLLGVATLSAVFRYWMRVGFIGISRAAELRLREVFFSRIQEQDQAFFDRHETGDLMSRLVNDIAIYREVMGPGILYPAFFVTLVIPALVALFVIAPQLAWIALIPILVLPLMMLLVRRILFRTSLEVQRSLGDMSALAQEDYSGIRLIKGYGVERNFSRRFRLLLQRFFANSLRMNAIENVFYPTLGLFGRWTTVALVMVAALGTVIGAADLVSFMWIQSYILVPVMMLGWILPLYQRGRGAYQRIYEVYSEPVEVSDGVGKAMPAAPEIEFVDCSFRYPGSEGLALDGVSCLFSAGKMTGIAGPPGAGKTTLFHLLNRDYSFGEGMIRVGGVPIESIRLDELRAEVAVIEQEPFLFSRTIGENIALARPEATLEEVVAAAKDAELHETIASLPKGYETMVGEKGVTLSGGEKQRVAIARALLAKFEVLLCDDIFSALDAATADRVFEVLQRLDKTILLVTHRLSLLERCDQVFHLKRGRLRD